MFTVQNLFRHFPLVLHLIHHFPLKRRETHVGHICIYFTYLKSGVSGEESLVHLVLQSLGCIKGMCTETCGCTVSCIWTFLCCALFVPQLLVWKLCSPLCMMALMFWVVEKRMGAQPYTKSSALEQSVKKRKKKSTWGVNSSLSLSKINQKLIRDQILAGSRPYKVVYKHSTDKYDTLCPNR